MELGRPLGRRVPGASTSTMHAGHRLRRLRPAPGAPAASATFSPSPFTFSTTAFAATATTATAATAALAKPTSAPTSAIASVAPLDDIQLHQYVRVCLRRLLSRWRARRAVVVLLFRHRLLRLPPTCSVSAAVATVAAVPAAAPALAATSNKAAISAITTPGISDGTCIASNVSHDGPCTASTSGAVSAAPTSAISVATGAFAPATFAKPTPTTAASVA